MAAGPCCRDGSSIPQSIPHPCHGSVHTQRGHSSWEVAAAKSSSVIPCPGNTLPWGERKFGGTRGTHLEVGVFPRAGGQGCVPPCKPCSCPSHPGQDDGHRYQCAGGGMGIAWLHSGDARYQIPPREPYAGFWAAPEWSSPSEKPLPGASRGYEGSRLHPSPPAPARACHYQHFSCTKKSTNFLIVSCWS